MAPAYEHDSSANLQTGPRIFEQHRELISGLKCSPKSIPCSYLYDPLGSELYDQVKAGAMPVKLCGLNAVHPLPHLLQCKSVAASMIQA